MSEGARMDHQRIREALSPHLSRQAARDLMVDLVRVPSPQTDLLEAEPQLRVFIMTAVAPRLQAMGVTDIRYDAMGNLIATWGEDSSGRSLLFCSHAMNQPEATMRDAYAGTIIDGRPHGLPGEAVLAKGVCEQKATMSAMLLAMEASMRSGVPIKGRGHFVCLTSGETGKHDAIASVVETEGLVADMCMIGGTSLKISIGNRGRVDVFVKVRGAPCHSSKPQEGVNAITGALRFIATLEAEAASLPHDPDLGPATLTINHIRSFPDSTHTIQDLCEFTIDRRLLPGEDPDEAVRHIEGIARRFDGENDPASDKPWSIEVERGPHMYPSRVAADSSVVRSVVEASQAMTGVTPTLYFSPSAFDQGYLNHVGIATCNYGPGEYQFAHTDLDMASVDRTFDAAKVYAFMILRHLM
jgi:acetylornithine deacetylase/succinyl-diaminopimelate desuccinylase-like protein